MPHGDLGSKNDINLIYLELIYKRGLFYAKMLNSKIYIQPPLEQYVWGAPESQGDLRSKNCIKTKYSYNFFIGGVYFMLKCKIPNF